MLSACSPVRRFHLIFVHHPGGHHLRQLLFQRLGRNRYFTGFKRRAGKLGRSPSWSEPVAVIVVTLILSYITLVFGELVPKRIALQRAEETSMRSVRPILLVSGDAPVHLAFVRLHKRRPAVFGMKPDAEEETVTEEDIRAQLVAARFDDHSRQMIDSVFIFDDKTARDVMVPRRHVTALDLNEPFEENVEQILDSGFSCIPVYEDEID